MPKGKAKRDNPELCRDAPYPPVRNAAPQAAAHRRGGVHRVRDEDKTGTVYDEWDYLHLKTECIARKIYIKDMKKVEMVQTLDKNDREKQIAERKATVENKRRKIEQDERKKKEDERKQKAAVARHRRRIDKQAKRDRDECVSDDTPDEEELQRMHNEMQGRDGDDAGEAHVGQMLSDESWTSTSSESVVHSPKPVTPDCRLRLFEWPYTGPPSPRAPWSPSTMLNAPATGPSYERLPRYIGYAPMKLLTLESKDKVTLPGQYYPPGVEPDYVPLLSRVTRQAARNGVLMGQLRYATIVRGSDWAQRTQVQGWNGCMFFGLTPRDETKNLAEVYNKWEIEKRKLLRVRPRAEGGERNRKWRHEQIRRDKAKKLIEIYDASWHRPSAMCYLPAYLDFEDTVKAHKERRAERTLSNLFYITFPDCHVPHYYFWARKGQWQDPTIPNPHWNATTANETQRSADEEMHRQHDDRTARKKPVGTYGAKLKTLIRVKRETVLDLPPLPDTMPAKYASLLTRFEEYLYVHGLAKALTQFRTKWTANGKSDAWDTFAGDLPMLYPSGKIPTVPPVHAIGDISLAEKMCTIEVLEGNSPLPPFAGNEPWTRDDDAYWNVVEADDDEVSTPNDVQDDLDRAALYRRMSLAFPTGLSSQECATWLEDISPSFPPITPGLMPPSPTPNDIQAQIRKEWEAKFLDQDKVRTGMDFICPMCTLDISDLDIEDQAAHMYSHDSIRRPMSRNSTRRRSSTFSTSFGALPPAARRPSCRITPYPYEDVMDMGADGDNEKTPMPTPTAKVRKSNPSARLTRPKSTRVAKNKPKPKSRRFSQISYSPPSEPSTHIPSPYLPTFKHYPTAHPKARWDPRRQSVSTFESLEFLEEFGDGMVGSVTLRYGCGIRPGRGERKRVAQKALEEEKEVLGALERRGSRLVGPGEGGKRTRSSDSGVGREVKRVRWETVQKEDTERWCAVM